ncbi:MAG: ABC transporter [Methylobacterium sp.]|nr:ABC transporter [Methylobacterium sp.]
MFFKRGRIVLLPVMLLAACIVPEPAVRPEAYDFGPLPSPQQDTAAALPVLQVLDVQAPRGMDGNHVQYRLAYVDARALRPYANSRWNTAPSQLLTQRMRQRLARQGPVVGSGEVQAGLLLKTELEQFEQVFDSAAVSRGVVRLRASLVKDRRLLAQQTFSAERVADSADARGGVGALTLASDALLDDLALWVAQQAR